MSQNESKAIVTRVEMFEQCYRIYFVGYLNNLKAPIPDATCCVQHVAHNI